MILRCAAIQKVPCIAADICCFCVRIKENSQKESIKIISYNIVLFKTGKGLARWQFLRCFAKKQVTFSGRKAEKESSKMLPRISQKYSCWSVFCKRTGRTGKMPNKARTRVEKENHGILQSTSMQIRAVYTWLYWLKSNRKVRASLVLLTKDKSDLFRFTWHYRITCYNRHTLLKTAVERWAFCGMKTSCSNKQSCNLIEKKETGR